MLPRNDDGSASGACRFAKKTPDPKGLALVVDAVRLLSVDNIFQGRDVKDTIYPARASGTHPDVRRVVKTDNFPVLMPLRTCS